MILGILAFGYLLLIVFLVRILRPATYRAKYELGDIPGSDMDINYCERPYIDKYL